MPALASIVREARRRAGLTPATLAARAGVPKSAVGRIESGARIPSADLVEQLVRAAGFELTLSLSEPDAGTDSMFDRTAPAPPSGRIARLDPPFNFHYRVVRRSCKLAGFELHAGDRLMLL